MFRDARKKGDVLIRARAKADIYNLYRRFVFNMAYSVIPLRASKTGKNPVVPICGLLMTPYPVSTRLG